MSKTASVGQVSAYVSRLRRAFLLQVHPDRFRRRPDAVRIEQARLVRALSDRMAERDFLAYTASSSRSSSGVNLSAYGTYPFSIERKDGSISKLSMPLESRGPHQIIESMAASIHFPLPPPPSVSEHPSLPHEEHEHGESKSHQDGAVRNDVDQFIWSWGSSYHGQQQHPSPSSRNRDVIHFLKTLNFEHVKQRKLDRINATAAVLVARRAFRFSAIDGTGLGWSSASLAICISRLTLLHEEHHDKLRTTSFFPFRVVLSSDEFLEKVDLFGGVIRLNPAATLLQWLGTLVTVTDASVRRLKENRRALQDHLARVEAALGCKAVKGHTCAAGEYHACIETLARESQRCNAREEGHALLAVSEHATVVIESAQACRRGKLRRDGRFEVGAGMDLRAIRATVGKWAAGSRERRRSEAEHRARCRETTDRARHEFGVQRVAKLALVDYEDLARCLSALLNRDAAEKDVLKRYLAGQDLGVAGRGQLCRLGDDGSIVIPTNCS